MNHSKLRKLAIEQLNRKDVQSIKNQLCEKFTDIIQKKECATAFDASFIESFISSFKVPEQWNR
jgi:hypothetical protein